MFPLLIVPFRGLRSGLRRGSIAPIGCPISPGAAGSGARPRRPPWDSYARGTPLDFTAKSVMELLGAALEVNVGVAFMPDEDGWTVSYVLPIDWPVYTEYELDAGPLSSAYDLSTAAAAAARPLREMGERIDSYLEHRDRSTTLRPRHSRTWMQMIVRLDKPLELVSSGHRADRARDGLRRSFSIRFRALVVSSPAGAGRTRKCCRVGTDLPLATGRRARPALE